MLKNLLPSLRVRRAQRSQREDHGQGMVEYAFIVILVAITCLLLVIVLGQQTSNYYSNVQSALNR